MIIVTDRIKILILIPTGRKVLYTHQMFDWRLAVVPAGKTIQSDVRDAKGNQHRHDIKLRKHNWRNPLN